MSDKKLTVSEFAGKIKAKYPEYKDINDLDLTKKIIAKYPEYESVVVFEEDSKKKDEAQEPFVFGVSELPSDSPSQETEEPSKEDQRVDDVLAFSDAFNPVGRIIKKTPVLAELNSGIESMVGSAFKLGEMFVRENVLAYATGNPGYAAAQNAINSAAPVDSKIADALGSVGDVFIESSSRAMQQKYRDYNIPDSDVELGIIGNLSEGNISSAAKLTASTMVQQVPQLAVMAATGGTAGGVILGATAAGGKYAEIQDDPTLTSQEKALYSLAIGTAEGIAENIFKTDVTQFRRIFNKKETTDAFKDELLKQLKKETLWRSSGEEATEEFLVAVTDNLIESGLKGNFDNWDREAVLEIADNTLIGGLMGGGVHSVSRGVNAIGSTKNERKIARAKQDVSDLYEKLENATDEQKPIIEELIEERLGSIVDSQSEDAQFYSNFTPEDLKSVNDLNKQIRKASKKYNLAASDSQKNVIKQELDDLRSKKEEIENKYSENPTRYIRDGKEVSRAEFVDMLNNATPEELTTGQWGVQNDDEVEQLLISKLPQDDRKEEERVPSAEQEGETPVQAEPIQEPSPEEAAPSGVVQEAKQVTLSDGTSVQEGAQVVANNPATGADIQGTLVVEGDEENPRISIETETDIVELGVANEITPSDIKPFTEAVKEAETLTANEDGTFTYNNEGNPTIAKGTTLTVDTDKGLSAVSVFSEGKFVPLTEDADREKGLRVQMRDQDGNEVQLYGQDALDATYNIMLALNATQAEQLNKLLDNEETINAIAEAEESARKDTKPAEEAERTAVEEVGERNSPEYVRSKVSQLQEEDVDNLKEELSGTFGLLTAENPDASQLSEEENAARNKEAEAWLREKGYSPRKIAGRFEGLAENSFFVPNLKLSDALAFAKKFGQKSVAHSEGMIYRDGTMNPRVKGSDSFDFADFKSKSDFVSTINTAEGPKTFSVGYDFDSRVDSGEALLAESDVSSEKFGSNFNTLKDNFQKLLSKMGGENIPVYVVSDEVYKSVTGKKGRATFTKINGKNVIALNADKATLGSVYHEMMHAYVATMNLSPRQIVDFVDTIRAELAKGNASERALAKRLTKFQTEYIKQEVYGKGLKIDDPIIAEEFLGEFVAELKDGIDVNNMSLSTIEKIRLAIAKFINNVFNTSIDTSVIENRQEAFDFINGFLDALEGRVAVESSITKASDPYRAQRSRLQIEVPAGSKLFNEPLEDATTLARQYMASKGLEYKEGSPFREIDEKRAKRISDAYIAMKDDPTNPAVAAAYKAMAEETLDQYEFISKAGYTVEMSDKEYDNSAQMIADLRDNKRMRIFSTEAGFGDDPITAKQRSENPLLQTTKYKDINGEPLLVNDVFRFVHDFFGHAKRGNSFGAKGEENAWDVHSRMYTPLARRAMTSETRGQNSYVNFSGVNKESDKLRERAAALRKEGKFAEAKELSNQAYAIMKFADQKVGLLPDEFVENPYDNAPSLLEEEEQGEAGEVGTINIPKQQIEVIESPKLSEDNRSFIQRFVTDVKMTSLQGRKFVTNMYDYTNSGVTNLGNGLSITLFGGRNYVPMMMERNGVELGEMSNLAAFNTKSNAEGFIKNAREGKADLFAPHSGTLTDSWQFQHHIFESLVNLVLDNKILSKSELIETFNSALKSKEAMEAFATFNERNKSRLKSLNSFKKDPLKLVELLDAENNYSPKLRKALNQKIASNKKFQKAIGVKNLNEFYNRISDQLNVGISGGEIMTFVEFDPKSFKVVKTKPGDANHHPSFGWVVMAKIKGIYHPDKYYKSYDITDSYTKYNSDGTKVERKADTTKKKFIDSNVKSSAGAIPKVAEVNVPKQQIEFSTEKEIAAFLKDPRYLGHATNNDFDKFDPDRIMGGYRGRYGNGIYFSSVYWKIRDYGKNLKFIDVSNLNLLPGSTRVNEDFISRIKELANSNVSESLKSKLKGIVDAAKESSTVLDIEKELSYELGDSGQEIAEMFKALGFDGISIRGMNNPNYEVVVFNVEKANESLVDATFDTSIKEQIENSAEKELDGEVLKALEKGEIPAPLYKKTWRQKLYSALFRTPLETELVKLQEKKEAQISYLESQAREISNRIKKYAKSPEALKLANEYLTSENKKDAAEAIKKLPAGQKLLDNLRVARAFTDNISEMFVNDPAFDGLPDDLKFAIQNNINTYLRTTYKFFTDKSYNIDKKRKPAIQAEFNRLVAQEIGLLGAMGVDKMDISRIVNEKRDELVAEATEIIDSYISDLKDVKYQPSTGGSGIKMPNAPFRKKKELPDYIKELLGEEKNPVNRFAQTSKSLANIYYKTQMVNGIIDLVGENSDYILDTEPAGLKAKQYKKVNDPYSKLDGKWVHKDVMDAIDQTPLFSSDDPFINGYYTVLKLARKSKVIWNITTWRKNLTGGWYFILANGIVNPTFYKDFTRRTKLMFSKTGEKFQVDDKTKELIRIMAEKGVSGKSIDANMIGVSQAAMQFAIDGNENEYNERAKRVFNNIANKDKWLQEKYAAVDDYTKLIIFRSEIESYAKKLYGKNYEQLNESQKDNVHEQAAERVKQSTPTFSRLPKWYNKIAWIPIVGDFISFRLESLRSYGSNVANAISDIKKSQEAGLDEVQKKEYLTAGLRRLGGSGAVFALKLAITKLLSQLFLDDDDEKLEEDVKNLRPDWMDGQSIIPRSIDKDGNVRVYNYSSEDPYGDVSDVFGGPESWGAMVKDFIRPNIAANLIFNLAKGEDIYGRNISDYSESRINNMLKVLQYTGKQIIVPPTVSSSFRDAWVKSELPVKDKAVDLASTIAERSIIRDYKYNVVDSFVQDLRKISSTRKTYVDYDNPTLRLKQLDDIKKQFESIVAIGLSKRNYDLIDKAERLMKRHLGSEDQDYVLDGVLIKK